MQSMLELEMPSHVSINANKIIHAIQHNSNTLTFVLESVGDHTPWNEMSQNVQETSCIGSF